MAPIAGPSISSHLSARSGGTKWPKATRSRPEVRGGGRGREAGKRDCSGRKEREKDEERKHAHHTPAGTPAPQRAAPTRRWSGPPCRGRHPEDPPIARPRSPARRRRSCRVTGHQPSRRRSVWTTAGADGCQMQGGESAIATAQRVKQAQMARDKAGDQYVQACRSRARSRGSCV